MSTVLDGGTLGSKIDTSSTLCSLLPMSPNDRDFSRLSSLETRPFFSLKGAFLDEVAKEVSFVLAPGG